MKGVKPHLLAMPIYREWLVRVRGVGDILAFQIVALIQPICDFATPSKLVAYCGYGCHDGKADRFEAGKQPNWSETLKVILHQLGDAMVFAGGPYRE